MSTQVTYYVPDTAPTAPEGAEFDKYLSVAPKNASETLKENDTLRWALLEYSEFLFESDYAPQLIAHAWSKDGNTEYHAGWDAYKGEWLDWEEQ